jgi:hypothetical protein
MREFQIFVFEITFEFSFLTTDGQNCM